MLRTRMNRLVVVLLVSVGALAGSAAVALAHNTPYSWSVTKAQLMLQDSTTIALPGTERAGLDAEIDAWLKQFRPLLLTAQAASEKDPLAVRLAQTYDTYITRFTTARKAVNGGLSIDTAKCTGLGKALKGNFSEKPGAIEKRYKHFRCNATSYVLEIPNIELKPGADPALPEVVEGPRRLIGPLQAVFTVHVRGKTRMLAQRTA
jgi:uncharacterized membrane protein